MGDCCSTPSGLSSIPPTVTVGIFIFLSFTGLSYDSVNNRIPCVFETNDDQASVSWTKNGVTLTPSDPVFDQTLDIQRKLGTSDTFIYMATLYARNKHSFEGRFECIATYDGKTKRKTMAITLSAPSAPGNLRVINSTSTSVSLAWDHPQIDDSNGNTITAYRVTFGIVSDNLPASQRSYTANSLQPNTLYHFSVFATTVVEGQPATVEVTTQEAAPSAPLDVRAFNTSSTSVQVEWNLPENLNGIIRGYRISFYITSNIDDPLAVMTQDVAGNETSYELTGLEIFTTYSIFVQGRTIALGNASSIVNVTTEEDAPSAPIIVQVFNTSSTSLRLEWIPPATPNGIIREYRISYYLSDDQDNVFTQIVAGNETVFELTGLEIYTTYSIFIQGRTIILGEASTTVNVTTDEDVPTAPINVTVIALNSISIQISWYEPASPNGVLLHYTIYYRQKVRITQEWETVSVLLDASSLGMNHLNLSSYTYELTGLLEFTQYQVSITASTRVGESNMSRPAIVTTDPESSDPPTAVTALPIDSSTIRISWGFPNVPRGRIQGYIVTVSAVNQDNVTVVRHNITLSTIHDMRNQTAEFDTLDVFTCYWFEVAAYSFSQPGDAFQIHHGLNSQPVMGCTFDEDVWFQLHIIDIGKSSCDQWMKKDYVQKLRDLEASIIRNVNSYCLCGFTQSYLKNGDFHCFPSSKTSVTYRGVLNGFGNTSSDDLIEKIEQWISRNVTIPIQTVLRPIDSTCTVRIASVDAEECTSETNQSSAAEDGSYTWLIIVIIAIVVVIGLASIAAISGLIVFCRYQKRPLPDSDGSSNCSESEDQASPVNTQELACEKSPTLLEKESEKRYVEIDYFTTLKGDDMIVEDLEVDSSASEEKKVPLDN